ncbi:MAG: hypothetical protein A2020_07535 [Lentisphaerae bacterium GWF2_45_14]|nr:MAG: hypothetical protein A2020_07535 [Lentisphaerae bacterium GWF2_45_14]
MRKKEPLYQRIYSELKKKIISGSYGNGEAFPSERVLKDEFNVSHLTVRKSLANLVKDGLIERKSGAGTIVTFNGNFHLVGGRLPRTVKFLSIIVEEANDFFSKILNVVESECRKQNIVVTFHSHFRDETLMRKQFERACRIDDDSLLLLFPVNSACSWLGNHDARDRTIIVDEYIKSLDAPQIISDDETGMYNVVKYLSDLGHNVIGHISSESKTTGLNRIKGYRKAVRELGLKDSSSLMENGSFLVEQSAFAFRKLLRANPDCTACACANDHAALGAMEVLRTMNLVPGRDFSVTGYGNFDISEALGLTSIDQMVEKIASQIMFLIDEFSLKGSMPHGLFHIPTELKIRSSCVKLRV